MSFHVEIKELPMTTGFMGRRQVRTVYVCVDDKGNESWECATKESADLRCAAINFDEIRGGRDAELLVTEFLSAESIHKGA